MHIDGILDGAKQKIKSLINKIKKFKSSYPSLFKALEMLLAAIMAGSILGITKYVLEVKQAEKRELEFSRLESLKGTVEVMGQDEIDAMDNKDIERSLNAYNKNKPYYYYAGKRQEIINKFRYQNPKKTKMTGAEYTKAMKGAQIRDIVKQILYEAINVKELLKSKIKSKIGMKAEQKPFKIQARESDIVTTIGPKRKPPLALTHDSFLHSDTETSWSSTGKKLAGVVGIKAIKSIPERAVNFVAQRALRTDFFVKKVDSLAKKLTLFANKHPMIAKIIRVLIKISEILFKIRNAVNNAVVSVYAANIIAFDREGLEISNRLFGLDVRSFTDMTDLEITKRGALGVLLIGVKETLIAMLRVFGKFVSTQMRPSNAV